MCTAITFTAKNHYFGRNLDLERRYSESVAIMPRGYKIKYRNGDSNEDHFAMIGMATVADNYPLYYDATNEYGLSIAGLNFVENACFKRNDKCKKEIAVFELIPYLLSQFKTVEECMSELKKISIVDTSFNDDYRTAELHWMIADKERCITLECTREGMSIHENTVGVLTNNPPFPFHMVNLCNYLNLTNKEPENRFSDKIKLSVYSRGMGALGMPGDLSSMSRFVRASFTKLNSVIPETEIDSIGQMFHILASVEQQAGSVKLGEKFERTQYASCCDMDKGVYYYRTYDNNQITAVAMFNEDLGGEELITYKLVSTQQIRYQN